MKNQATKLNYREGLRRIQEMNVSADIWGGGAIGTYGGAFGNTSGAYGSAGIVLPDTNIHPYAGSRRKRKGSKKQHKKPHLYRRAFTESLMSESTSQEQLACVIHTDNVEYQQVIQDALEHNGITYEDESDSVIIRGVDEELQSVMGSIERILGEDVFKSGEVVALICEMDESAPLKRYSSSDIANKHDIDVESVEELLDTGSKIELEHTDDEDTARIIASAHIWEDLEYYDKLSKIEGKRN